jgi:hypothetical protein
MQMKGGRDESTGLLQSDEGGGIGLERKAGSHEKDGRRLRVAAKGKSSPADRAARTGGRERSAAGGTARERVSVRLSPIKNELDELFGTIGSNLDRKFQEMSSRETLW